MTAWTFDLGDIPAGTTWSGAIPLPSHLVEGGAVTDLEAFGNIGGTFVFQTGGPDLTGTWEGFATAIRVVDDAGASIIFAGPNHPNNVSSDPREPYTWIPGNSAAVDAWFGVDRNGVTLTLDDGVDRTTHDARGTAAAGAPVARAEIVVLPSLSVRGDAAAGGPIATAHLAVRTAHHARGTAAAGVPAISARVAVRTAHHARGTAAAGMPIVQARMFARPPVVVAGRIVGFVADPGDGYADIEFDAPDEDDLYGVTPRFEVRIDGGEWVMVEVTEE